jgi:hypothetical protein
MADVLVSTDDLTVLGGPASVDVEVSFGPEGQRGSVILVGNGKPNDPTTVIGETPQVYDMFINILSSDSEYMYIYQYLNLGVATSWVKLMKLTPNTYSVNYSSSFVDGAATINIPITNIVPSYTELLANITSASFNVQCNITSQLPISFGLSLGSIVIDPATSVQILPITINAVEYSSESWSPISGTKQVHLYITVV